MFPVYDTYEEANDDANKLSEQNFLPEDADERPYDCIVSHVAVPETTGDVELDEDGFPQDENLTGRWLVKTAFAWKAWIDGGQYGNYVLAPTENKDDAWKVLDHNYHETLQELTAQTEE